MWTAEEEAQFLTIRDCLTQAPILAHPDWSLPFEVHTEASREGLGAVLVQRQGGQEVAIGYASRARTGAEKPFAVWELEGLTVVWACRLFRMYLFGGKFKIVTDHRAMQTILKADYKAAGGRLAQWSLALQDFDYELIHRAGVLNGIADALSRNPLPSTDPYSIGPTDLEPQPMLAITTDWDYVSTFDGTKPLYAESDTVARSVADWHEEQQKDATCVRVIAALNAPGANDAKAQESARPERRAAEYKVPTTLRAFVLHRYHSIEKKKKIALSGHDGAQGAQHPRMLLLEGHDQKDLALGPSLPGVSAPQDAAPRQRRHAILSVGRAAPLGGEINRHRVRKLGAQVGLPLHPHLLGPLHAVGHRYPAQVQERQGRLDGDVSAHFRGARKAKHSPL
jgi:hypothetical protein